MSRNIETIYPSSSGLSRGQEAMWLIYQIASESVAYNIFITAKIYSYLKIPVVNRVWQKIIEKHPILRTTYTSHEGKPVQQVNQQLNFSVGVIDASEWSEDHLREKIYAIADTPFNLEKDSVLRVNLFTLSPEDHILLLTMHHIAGDMWSFNLLLGEFQRSYTNEIKRISQGQPETVDSLSEKKSYADFVHWQSEMLSGSKGEKQWQYWQKQLAGELPILNLLPDKPRPPVKTYQGASYIAKLDEQLIEKLKHLALATGTTLYRILLTVFYVQLYRYTNQTDILIGSPMRGRTGKEFKEIVGYFSNLTVLRVFVEENATFTELLAQVSKIVRQAQKHQDYPFSLLVEKLQPQRDPSRSPFCQVSFTWQAQTWCEQKENLSPSQEPMLQMAPYLLGHQRGADFDLSLMVMEAAETFQLNWQYNTDLFEDTTITPMAGHFVTLLESIVENPQQPVSLLPLLTQREQHQLLVEWNNTKAEYPSNKCIHQLFEEQVERTPDAVAVVFEEQQLTYNELNCRANQLAHYLQSLGVKPDELVGICVERSLEMIVGLLGILKAGGAYVPLDPDYPIERLSFMLEDAAVKVLLTQQELIDKLPEHQAQLICLDADWTIISKLSKSNLINTVTSENLAYVIYTSGSTGLPKGTLIPHQGLVNYLSWCTQAYNVEQGTGTLVHSPLGFDLTITSLFSPLLVGNQVEILAEDQDVETLSNSLRHHSHLSLVKITPAHLELLNQQLSPREAASRTMAFIIGGENLLGENIAFWQEFAPETLLVNEYGPTETVVGCCIYQVPMGKYISGSIPIGRPIANTQLYILDQNLQPVPIGIPGELYIGGAGLARGYLNRPELTQEKFIPNPFDNSKVKNQKSKLYKTGDLCRYLPDGNIEYLGRIDSQVKIRGFRIELGEIEAVLTQYPQVQSSVIIAREDTPGNKRLVAYIVPEKEATPTPNEMRQCLKEKLPEYMIPSAFVILESLPLTPNGKIDRRALPAPEQNYERTDKFILPRNPIEEILVTIWTEVLKVQQISINDNFFELGGHSLLATQLISRIRTNLSIEIPLRSLFAAPTIEELGQQIQQLQQEDLTLSAPPILPRGEQSELLLSYAQTRLWFLDQLEPNSPFYNIPVALRLRGHLNQAALTQSLEEIIQRHEALRTNFVTVNGQPTQVIQTVIKWTVSVINLQHLSPEEQKNAAKKLVKGQALQPFDLANEALVRATLIVLNNNEYWLSLCLHHVISDGWSMGVFIEELTALYNAVNQGQVSPLKPLPIQYTDFAIWQRKWFRGEVLENQLNYWKKQLAEAPTFLPLPTDKPRPARQSFTGAHQEFQLSLELTQKLTELSQQQGVTMFMTLLAAYGTLLYRYTGQSDILIGTPIANRNRREIESLIGFFVNTLVMRTDCSENPSFQELLMRVREMSLGAYTHQDLPFEMLVEALQPERNLSHTPLFQVMFALENTPLSEVKMSGLTIDSLPLEWGTAKFDLTLSMQNTETGLMGVWEYNTDLFNSETVERMNGHFLTLLEGIIANPNERVSQLPLLTKVEQQQLLIDGHNTQVDYPADKCIHQLFEEQVERTPNDVAVVFEEQQLTYNELNRRANQLAHYLQSLGVKPDELVGICVERSLEMIVGLLGILKAGGAYVPLDPDYPQERLSFMLEDSQVKVLVTQAKLVESIPEHQAQLICLDTEWEKIAQNIPSNPESGVKPDNLTYIIYTSGSTGKPKGVLVNHANVVRLFAATDSWYHFNSNDVWTLFHSYAFDFSVWEMWGALLYGGRLVVVPYLVTRSPEAFYQLLCQEKVTILNQTPTAFRQLIQVEESLKGSFPPLSRGVRGDRSSTTDNDLSLRLVIFGGEALEINSLQPWFNRHGDQCPQLVNMYGITETTVHVTYRPLSMTDLDSTASVIGCPIPDLQVYLLDQYLQLVPVGVPGEMYVGGAGVTKGYLNRPELTTERFIPSPFEKDEVIPPTPLNKGGTQGGAKLYKTGDLARYLPKGELEYLGRIDNQVKIRGFRIELGEIEALLASHPQIWETVVIVRDDTTGDKRLVAYIVPQSEKTITINEIRQFLKAKLPSYMVPNAFVILDALPLTANGKIDRRALPPSESSSEPSEKYVAPRNPIEDILVNVWSEILKVEKVGINDNFFELGGHSLLATKLVAQIRDHLKIELPLRQLFNTATLAELAQGIEQLKQQTPDSPVPTILPRKRK
ncbi:MULTISPECIES: non-ribosomal peptide synthetase [unclassified Microcystis]|uniref:non-ribosomal peptide synthetase n=3 Tax=Microcystis TaxID=1125 RepID=UPI00119228B4|nr:MULTISPECIES: non-ribosomal peptide synthetase [unclassified Microcystis]MCA2928013.1 amino acid adenylation domain-containing protein [Microcystis sp. M020S1]MCA2937141.1 amino acid adenylation domain-containing protein [Microcystis sp. M015S1]MCA2621160.1 amino acid adenylation domain-containing protein [Microcystis sp. M099S2]MCA2650932.1 amino acid adenylation domain-containing protein [Microcystis sp. M065S2]MCA2679920.1 amino acid adenylation domain-containing protein [Microcystis sp.